MDLLEKLNSLIDQSVKKINLDEKSRAVGKVGRREMHDLRVQRNSYAHGHGRSVFHSVPKVETIVARFMDPFP